MTPPNKKDKDEFPFSGLEVGLSDRCNLGCSWCYAARNFGEGPDIDRTKRILTWFFEQGFKQKKSLGVTFYGGEPLVEFEDLKQIIGWARNGLHSGEDIRFGVVTNCTLLTPEVQEWLIKNKIRINTSIDGCPEAIDTYRCYKGTQEGASKEIISNVGEYLKRKPSASARMTIAPATAHLLFESVRFLCEDLGYPMVNPILAGGVKWEDDTVAIIKKETARITDWWIGKMQGGKHYSVYYLRNMLRGIWIPKRTQRLCAAGIGRIGVDTKGDIWPCHRFCNLDSRPEYRMGNVLNGGFTNTELHRKLKTFSPARDMVAKCQGCVAVNSCFGICTHETMLQNKGMFEPPPQMCQVFPFYWREALRAHAVLYGEGNELYLKHYDPARRKVRRQRRQRPPSRPKNEKGPAELPRHKLPGCLWRGANVGMGTDSLYLCGHPEVSRKVRPNKCLRCPYASKEIKKTPSLQITKGRIVILRREGYRMPYTKTLKENLTLAGWKIDELTIDRDTGYRWEDMMKSASKPAAVIRWEEHGCLFVTNTWRQYVKQCYDNDILPLSVDFGYFDHYNTLMFDRYREDGSSSIWDDWPFVPYEVDWSKADPRLQEYREILLKDYAQAEHDGPITDRPYVAIFAQFTSSLSTLPCNHSGDWMARVAEALKPSQLKPVFKLSPVFKHEPPPGYPVFKSKGENIPRINARLCRFAEYAITIASSVTNEFTICGIPVWVSGRSWFHNLGIFSQAKDYKDFSKRPKVDETHRGKWINWWLEREFYVADAAKGLDKMLNPPARPKGHPDYRDIYNRTFAENPTYRWRRHKIMDAVREALKTTKNCQTVLDVGTGGGIFVSDLLSDGWDAFGCDIARIERKNIPAVRFKEADVLALPYKDNQFDIITCLDLLEHIHPSDLPQALSEIKRVAGKYVIFHIATQPALTPAPEGIHNLHLTVMAKSAWVRYLQEHGFNGLNLRHPWFIIYHKGPK